MRIILLAVSLLLSAAPAAAQPVAAPEVQQALANPATVDQLSNVLESLSGALLNLPVGEVRAAVEGRRPTAADKGATVGSETGLSEDQLRAGIAAAKPSIRQSMKVLSDALPGILQGMAQAQRSIERAAANMPDPNYPKR